MTPIPPTPMPKKFIHELLSQGPQPGPRLISPDLHPFCVTVKGKIEMRFSSLQLAKESADTHLTKLLSQSLRRVIDHQDRHQKSIECRESIKIEEQRRGKPTIIYGLLGSDWVPVPASPFPGDNHDEEN